MSQPSLFDDGDLEPAPGRELSPVELASRLGLDSLPTAEQADAVRAPMRPHVVVAGAGSGKTQTMGLRVVWLVANGRVEPHRILGLTFTRKAAAELGDRVRRMLHRLQHAHEQAPFLPDDVAAALAALGRRGVTSLFLEGGRTLAAAFAAAGEIDEARVFVAPILLGGGERLVALDSGAEDNLVTTRFREW